MDTGPAPAIFCFFSKSADVYPGKGAGESLFVPEETYRELSKVKDWRKMLSNFWVCDTPLLLDGGSWASVEHYYQGCKFAYQNVEYRALFSLESNSAICRDPVLAKAAGGKTGKYAGKALRPRHIQADPDFFTSGRDTVCMQIAQSAKFSTAHPELLRVLLLTTGARLDHRVGRSGEKVRFEYLERLRG